MRLKLGVRSLRQFTTGAAAPPSVDPTQRVLIPYSPVKLDDLNPLMRNDNVTTDAQEIKIGPSAWMKIGGTWHGWVEGIQNTGFPAGDGMTAMMKATTTSLQGPYTLSPATTRVRDATGESTWEHWEHSFADIVLYGGNLIAMYHGGNNSGPQNMGLDRTTDTTLGTTGWTAEASNPILVGGATGAWDDRQCGNDFKLVRYKNAPGNPFTGKLWGVYRGRKTGGLTDGLTGRATVSSDYTTFTKDPAGATGQVIFSAPSWNAAGGRTSGTPVLDEGARAHMWYPGGFAGIGKSYSDDDGLTWTDENSGNRVISPSGAVGTYDYNGSGDVVQAIWDGDVVFLLYGTENIVNYATNNPMRGASGAIVPFPKVTPTKKGKFFLASARTDVTSAALLAQTAFCIMGRFRVYRTKRNGTPRVLYWEEPTGGGTVGNKQVLIQIDANGGANAGKLNFFYRTPTTFINIFSTAVVDDTLWHTFLARRISASSFELYLDGVLQSSSALSPGTDATATLKSIGNWNPATSETGDGPLNGTISDLGTVTGAAWTAAEATAWITARTNGTGGTLVVNFPTDGTDSGNAVLVEGT